MNYKLKRIDVFLKINKKLSDFCFKWLTIKNFRKNNSQLITEIYPPFKFNVNLENYSIPGSPYWKAFFSLNSDQLFYAIINKATIVSKGIVLNKRKEVILESTIFQIEYLKILLSNHLVKLHYLLPYSKEERVFSLLNKLDNNYFHWTLESLTRVLLVYDKSFFKDYKIIIKHEPQSFIKESLQFLFNIKDDQIIEKPLYQKLKTEEALVVSFPHIRNETTQNTNVYYPFVIQKLNELAHDRLKVRHIKEVTPKNIIISRKNAIERRILNEETLIEAVHKHDFKIVYLENLSFIEQVSLFANAETIISVHGAGITNVIYGKKLLLIEFFPKQRIIRDAYYFTQITGALNLEHHVLIYEEENNKQDLFLTKKLLVQINEIIDSRN